LNWPQGFSNSLLAQPNYSSCFPLADITMISDDQIDKHREVALLEMMKKHIYDRNLLAIADQPGS